MKLSDNLGMLLLGIWLILTGLLPLINLSFPASGTILALLAIAAGVLILLGGRVKGRRLPSNLGMLLLGIWLILTGLLPLINLSFPASGTILALLAVAAGVLILLRR
jgi:FtsH-binding integral membrane protein